jgi:Mg2+ and Co2+ transporter CorA
LKEIKDIMDELNSIRNIFKQQQQALNLMSNDYQAGQNSRPEKDQEKLEQLQSLQEALKTRVERIKELEIEAKRAYEAVGRYSV